MTVTSVHVLRYEAGRGWPEIRSSRPPAAGYWHPGVFAPLGAAGIPIPDESEWTVLATYPDAASWQQALAGPGPWTDARESWSCLLSAGETRNNPSAPSWADGFVTPPFGPPSADEPSGPVAIVTTVGLSAANLDPVLRFARDVEAIVDTLSEAQGCLGYRLGGAEDFPQSVDAFTFSLWATWADARRWAYRGGVHARAMRDHMATAEHVLRGSFTTFGVLATAGATELVDGELDLLLAKPADRRLRLTAALSS